MSVKYRTNPFFNGVSTFRAAFPDVGDALIEWRERYGPEDPATGGDFRKTGFKRGNFTQGVSPCSNPSCHEGGYEFDRLVAAMLREGQSERTGMLLCSGREVAEETRRGPVRCPHRIEYRAMLSPKGSEQSAPEDKRAGHRKALNRRGRGRPARRAETA